MFSTRASWSDAALLPPTGDLERSHHAQELFLRTVYYHEGPGNVSDEEFELIHTLDQGLQLLDREGPPPSPASRSQSAPAVIDPEIESDLRICGFI